MHDGYIVTRIVKNGKKNYIHSKDERSIGHNRRHHSVASMMNLKQLIDSYTSYRANNPYTKIVIDGTQKRIETSIIDDNTLSMLVADPRRNKLSKTQAKVFGQYLDSNAPYLVRHGDTSTIDALLERPYPSTRSFPYKESYIKMCRELLEFIEPVFRLHPNLRISSALRPPHVEGSTGSSNHVIGCAVDIFDKEGSKTKVLQKILIEGISKLIKDRSYKKESPIRQLLNTGGWTFRFATYPTKNNQFVHVDIHNTGYDGYISYIDAESKHGGKWTSNIKKNFV